MTTSDQFLELDTLPGRIVFVGGGYISFEFAHVAARAGAQVTLLHRGSRPLVGFDPDLVDLLVERTRKLVVEIELQTVVKGIERASGGLVVHASTTGVQRRFDGRVPEIDDLDLDAAGCQGQ